MPIAAGMDGYVTKPIRIPDLVGALLETPVDVLSEASLLRIVPSVEGCDERKFILVVRSQSRTVRDAGPYSSRTT